MKKILSIIIPVYNIQAYLKDCLDKLICYKENYEIILINDGSTDDSLKICELYASKYAFIHLYNQSNKGVSAARNLGIHRAKGEYLYFVDGDDFLIGLTSIINTIEQNKFDLYTVNYDIIFKGAINCSKRYIDARSYSIHDFYVLKDVTFHALWGFVFKRDIIINNKILFDENLKYAEDWIFVTNYFLYVEKVYTIPDSIYNYRLFRLGSAMSTPLSSNQLSLHFYAYDMLSELNASSCVRYIIDKEKIIMMLHIINQICEVSYTIRKKCSSQSFLRKKIELNMFFNVGFKYQIKLLIAFININCFAFLRKKLAAL